MIGDAVTHALSYPFAAPPVSMVLHDDGSSTPLAEAVEKDLLTSGRHGVLASGSNRAPEQLRSKFNGLGLGDIPISLASLPDHDCVYSAHITRYGSVPATLYETLGTTVSIAVTWLSDEQLTRMHETEAIGHNYAYEAINTPGLRTVLGHEITRAFHYRSLHGLFVPDGKIIALAEVPAVGRIRAALSQREVLAKVHGLLGQQLDLEMFIYRMVNDALFRAKVTEHLPRLD